MINEIPRANYVKRKGFALNNSTTKRVMQNNEGLEVDLCRLPFSARENLSRALNVQSQTLSLYWGSIVNSLFREHVTRKGTSS